MNKRLCVPDRTGSILHSSRIIPTQEIRFSKIRMRLSSESYRDRIGSFAFVFGGALLGMFIRAYG